MPATNTPNYGNRIDRLKNRLDNKGVNRQKIRGRISDVRAQQYLSRQKNQPDPTLPFNAEYETTVAGLNRNRDVAMQNNAYERQMAQSNYGFDNPLANPYSRAAILQRSYNQANQGLVNDAASSGQLYSGSTQTGLDQTMFNFGQEWNSTRSEYENELRALTDKDTQAQTDYGDALKQAEDKRLAAALETEVDPLSAPDSPKNVKRFLRSSRKDIRQLEKQGKDNKADKLRARLRKLGVNNGR